MSHLKFNHVFFALMGLALVSAFVFSPSSNKRAQAQVANIFAPVAWPANRIAGWARERLMGRSSRDDGSPNNPRTAPEVLAENMALRISNASLQAQLDQVLERESTWAQLGEVRSYCTAFSVIGGDSGSRESLMLYGTSLNSLAEGMPVIYSSGLVGRLIRVGLGEARVLLITDPQSKIIASFARPTRHPDGKVTLESLSREARLVEGAGTNELVMRDVPERFVQDIGLRIDDWVVLSDSEWPALLRGYRLGAIYSIENAKTPSFALIRIRPDQRLSSLREVMVVNKVKR